MNLKLVDDVSWQILAVLMPSVRLILQLRSSTIITDAVIFSRTHNKNNPLPLDQMVFDSLFTQIQYSRSKVIGF